MTDEVEESDNVERCWTCKFFNPQGLVKGRGLCLRYPPKPIITREFDQNGFFPIVLAGTWCGEFQWKEQKST